MMAMDSNYVRQAAAIPIRQGRLCLITSSNRKRWVIPKGSIDPGHSAGEAALIEAWEEAGLVGVINPEPVGTYLYEKWYGVCHVTVFLMDVTLAANNFPECRTRERRWVTPAGALERVDDPGLADVLRLAFRKKFPAALEEWQV